MLLFLKSSWLETSARQRRRFEDRFAVTL